MDTVQRDRRFIRWDLDAHAEPLSPLCGSKALIEWLESHGLVPARIRRVQITASDELIVHEFRLDEYGHRFVLPGRDECALKDPYFVPLRSEPSR